MLFMRLGIFLISFFLVSIGSAAADHKDPRLNALFNQLAKASSSIEAGTLSIQIAEIWRVSGSDTADLLMDRASASIEQQDFDTALKLLNTVVQLRPGFAEVYYQRANIHLRLDSTKEAAADLAKAVSIEPRDFRAHALIGSIADDAGQYAVALSAYRRALSINPGMDGIVRRANELSDLEKSRSSL
jgi:tetratricopeptide (TPR) repeat protein